MTRHRTLQDKRGFPRTQAFSRSVLLLFPAGMIAVNVQLIWGLTLRLETEIGCAEAREGPVGWRPAAPAVLA